MGDHMRIIAMEQGADIKNVFARFVQLVDAVEEEVEANNSGFEHNEHLGYVLTCPSNLGTGLRASMMVKLPVIGARSDFKDVCERYRLQPRGSGGVDSEFNGTFDISNTDRLGKSEVDLVNIMIAGVAELIKLEKVAAADKETPEEIADADKQDISGEDAAAPKEEAAAADAGA